MVGLDGNDCSLSDNSVLKRRKDYFSHILFVASVISCLVISALAVISGVVSAFIIFAAENVEIATKVLLMVAIAVVFLSVVFFSYVLIKKSLAMQIVFVILSLLLIIFTLAFCENFWFGIYDFLHTEINLIFNVIK